MDNASAGLASAQGAYEAALAALRQAEANDLKAQDDGGAHGAAARLGVPRTSLIYRMQKLGIPGRRDMYLACAQSREMARLGSRLGSE